MRDYKAVLNAFVAGRPAPAAFDGDRLVFRFTLPEGERETTVDTLSLGFAHLRQIVRLGRARQGVSLRPGLLAEREYAQPHPLQPLMHANHADILRALSAELRRGRRPADQVSAVPQPRRRLLRRARRRAVERIHRHSAVSADETEDLPVGLRPRPAVRRLARLPRPRAEAAARRGRRAGRDAAGPARAQRRTWRHAAQICRLRRQRVPVRRRTRPLGEGPVDADRRPRPRSRRDPRHARAHQGQGAGADRPARLQVDDRAARRAARRRRRLSAIAALPADAGARALGRDHAEPADGAVQRQQSRRPQAGGRALLRRGAGDREVGEDPHRRVHRRFPHASTAIRSRR